jgi:RHS repeat-associated protein
MKHHKNTDINPNFVFEEQYSQPQFAFVKRDTITALDYRGARYYDCDVARFLSVDPLANKYPSLSTYNYVAGNPIRYIDPTGKYFIGVNGEKVKIKKRKGELVIRSNNASEDLKELINDVNSTGSKVAKKEILKGSRNRTVIHVKIEHSATNNGLLGLHQAHDKNGNVLNWNSTINDFDGIPAYKLGLFGKRVYSEATITIFKGNMTEEQVYYETLKIGKSINQEILSGRVFQHEVHHDTDKSFIDNLRKRRVGKTDKVVDPHQNIHTQDDIVRQQIFKSR